PAGAAPVLGPAEAHSRFVYAFRKFVRVFATPEHPLVVFLDDLQWADLASLKLFEGLVGDDELRHLLVIGAYRDGEVDAAHPLTQTIA
ncbi:AAA family ATPase, partial [Vibrio parahaemolyticus]